MNNQSFVSFLWLSMGMGAISLLTPCVFPMIPITVSYFASRPAASRKTAVLTALIYSLGIILTFTALGTFLAIVFGAAGINHLAANPWINLLITAIFLGFAFSMMGAFFIQLPTGIMNKLDRLTRANEGIPIVGTLLMGLTFSLTSFTCTAPFVGTLLVMASQGNWRWPLLGMLGFSFVFSIPFFVLALMPQLMAQLPKAGGWMNVTKVVMAFLEIAAAMKFLSNADLIWHWGVFTRSMVLSIWIAVSLTIVFYLLGKIRTGHDAEIQSVSAPRLLFSLAFLSLAIWMVTGLFGKPLGELESFLPPDQQAIGTQAKQTAGTAAPTWIMNDLQSGMAQAKKENKSVLVDFTGYTCTNCRWMEANMFTRPQVQSKLEQFVRVRLYTDGDGKVYEDQQEFEKRHFGTVALPLYVILNAKGETIATYPGLTRDTGVFMGFLDKGAGS